ncbi:Tuberous sclerosis 2-like protein [Lignoscripta atroalba]|nr:Tuberous sclerosis 2-like protein [Lignoscripta atroalba]
MAPLGLGLRVISNLEAVGVNFRSVLIPPQHMNPSEEPQDTADPSIATSTTPSSLTERVRSLTSGRNSVPGHRTRSRIVDPADTTDLDTVPRPESYHGRRPNPATLFKEKFVRDLDKARSLSERLQAIRAACEEIEVHSGDTLVELWTAAEDLTVAGASVEARKIGYTLLIASATHTGLGPIERLKLFTMIVVPIEAAQVILQIEALDGLTNHGRNLDPFKPQLVKFLHRTVRKQFEDTVRARSHLKNVAGRRSKVLLAEEEGFEALLSLIADVIRHNHDAFQGDELIFLVDRAVFAAQKTTAIQDLHRVVAIIQAIIAVSQIPSSQMKGCVQLLCSISCKITELKQQASQLLLALIQSPQKAIVLDIVLTTILESPQDKYTNTTRGALGVVKQLIAPNGIEGLPTIPFRRLVDALWEIYFIPEARHESLQIIGLMLNDENRVDLFLQEDWETMMKIIRAAAGNDRLDTRDRRSTSLRTTLFSGSPQVQLPVPPRSGHTGDSQEDVLKELKHIVDIFVSLWTRVDEAKKSLIASFFLDIRSHLSTAPLELLITQMVDEGFLLPGQPHWEASQIFFVNKFILDDTIPPTTRSKALQVLKELCLLVCADEDKRLFGKLVTTVVKGLSGERDVYVINDLADFATFYIRDAEIGQFKSVLAGLWRLNDTDDTSLPPWRTPMNTPVPNMIPTYIVRLFLQCLPSSGAKAIIVYDTLVKMATTISVPTNARLTAMKLLTRLRCNHEHAVVVIPVPDTFDLAATLCRTEASALSLSGSANSGDRSSLNEDQQPVRVGRTSTVNLSGLRTSRSNTRSASGQDRHSKPSPPLWMYPGGKGLPENPPREPSQVVHAFTQGSNMEHVVRLSPWLVGIMNILQKGCDWELYSYTLVHLPSQLGNPALFAGAIPSIKMLRNVITSQLQGGNFQEPPPSTGVKKGDVALCLFHSLIMLLGYNEHFGRSEQDEIVRTILGGIGAWDRVAKCCIHALSICCHEIPLSIARSLNGILQKMSQIITQSHLAMDTLEFLGGLARLPGVYVNLTEDELRTVFAICIKYLEHSREQRLKLLSGSTTGASYASNRHSGTSAEFGSASELSQSTEAYKDLPQYVFALAYHVITIWFLSLRLADRSKHVGWITRNLAWTNATGNEIMEEQSQVTLDMMHRTAYLNLGETTPITTFRPSDGRVVSKTWLVGLSLLTVETAVGTGRTQLIKRQASGTTYAEFQQHTAPLPPHHVPAPSDIITSAHGPDARINVFPNHIFLQLMSNIAPTPAPMEPICLPDDEVTKRAISTFDRNDTVDGHKVGVIYVGNAQTLEREILANNRGSEAFDQLLSGLGTKVQLRGANFNTQGLDRDSDLDGTHTYAWRDRITEIVFHVPTMMPTNVDDPQCINKKKHIGNDFVNIIFNESGLPFKFDTFRSQYNFVNIVITPEGVLEQRQESGATEHSATASIDQAADGKGEAVKESPETGAPVVGVDAGSIEVTGLAEAKYPERQTYFKIRTLVHASLPPISPAASYKLVSATALPGLTRQIALNASVFSLVWANREGGEHISSWRNRLREIVKLRERFVNTGTSTSTRFPGARQEKKYVDGDQWKGTVAMGGLAEEEGILSGLDFSRWAGPNPGVI